MMLYGVIFVLGLALEVEGQCDYYGSKYDSGAQFTLYKYIYKCNGNEAEIIGCITPSGTEIMLGQKTTEDGQELTCDEKFGFIHIFPVRGTFTGPGRRAQETKPSSTGESHADRKTAALVPPQEEKKTATGTASHAGKSSAASSHDKQSAANVVQSAVASAAATLPKTKSQCDHKGKKYSIGEVWRNGYVYKCDSNGQTQITACIADESKIEIPVGQTKDHGGLRHICKQDGRQTTYLAEVIGPVNPVKVGSKTPGGAGPAPAPAPSPAKQASKTQCDHKGKKYAIGEVWRNGYVYLCDKDGLVQITACISDDKQIEIPPNQSKDHGGLRHHCKQKGRQTTYLTEVIGTIGGSAVASVHSGPA